MIRRVYVALFALVLASSLHAAQATDLTGKWNGSFVITMDGQGPQDDSIYMTLTQKGNVLTGTAGPSAERQWTIVSGKIEGGKVTFEVQSEGPLVKFTLALADGRLKGSALAEMDGRKMSAVVDAARSK